MVEQHATSLAPVATDWFVAMVPELGCLERVSVNIDLSYTPWKRSTWNLKTSRLYRKKVFQSGPCSASVGLFPGVHWNHHRDVGSPPVWYVENS